MRSCVRRPTMYLLQDSSSADVMYWRGALASPLCAPCALPAWSELSLLAMAMRMRPFKTKTLG